MARTIIATLVACLCAGAATADNTLMVHLEAFGVWASGGGETTNVEHAVTAVSGPGVSMGVTTGCNPMAVNETCEGSFTVTDVATIENIQIVWSPGPAHAYFFLGEADAIELQFQAIDTACEGNHTGNDIDPSRQHTISGCGGQDGFISFSGCEVFLRVDLGNVPNETELGTVVMNASFPPLGGNWSGREVTFEWGSYTNIRIKPNSSFSVSLVNKTDDSECSVLACDASNTVSVAGELCMLNSTDDSESTMNSSNSSNTSQHHNDTNGNETSEDGNSTHEHNDTAGNGTQHNDTDGNGTDGNDTDGDDGVSTSGAASIGSTGLVVLIAGAVSHLFDFLA